MKNIKTRFYASIKTFKKHRIKNMFIISCVTCRYRISEGSKTALSGDLTIHNYCRAQ